MLACPLHRRRHPVRPKHYRTSRYTHATERIFDAATLLGAPGQFGCFRPVNLKGRPKATAALYAGPELAGGLQVALSNVTMKLTTTTRDIRRPRGRPSSGKALYRGPRPWGS